MSLLSNSSHLRISVKRDFFDAYFLSFSFFCFCISQLFLSVDERISVIFKILGILFLVAGFLSSCRCDNKILLLIPLIFLFLINFLKSHDTSAAIDELIRYFFPIIILVALYSSKKNIKSIARLFVLLVLSNDIYQVYFYIAFFLGLPTITVPRYELGYIIKAAGWMDSFVAFGFMNFCAFILIRHGKIYEKENPKLEYVFLIFSVLSTSLKAIAAIMIYFLFVLKTKKGFKQFISIILVSTITILVFKPDVVTKLYNAAGVKASVYIVEGNSARGDSYRVMFESLMAPNFFGEGLGTFGGPASTKYLSPLYEKYNFNWYALENKLRTTDTYYPHVFIELGIVGGFLYLYFIFFYGQKNRSKMWWVVVLAFAADNVTSFSIAAPPNYFAAALTMLFFSSDPVMQNKYACT